MFGFFFSNLKINLSLTWQPCRDDASQGKITRDKQTHSQLKLYLLFRDFYLDSTPPSPQTWDVRLTLNSAILEFLRAVAVHFGSGFKLSLIAP